MYDVEKRSDNLENTAAFADETRSVAKWNKLRVPPNAVQV